MTDQAAKPKDWFAPSFDLSEPTRQAIAEWVATQQWPEGFKPHAAGKYHVTAFWAKTGQADPASQQWVKDVSGPLFEVSVRAVEVYGDGAGDKGYPIVLVLEGDEIRTHGEQLREQAAAIGIPVSLEWAYSPHITLGYSPQPIAFDPPALGSFTVGPLFELHDRYDQLKAAKGPELTACASDALAAPAKPHTQAPDHPAKSGHDPHSR